MISMLVLVSRFPVGSSARMSGASLTRALRDGNPLLLPAGELVRVVMLPPFQPQGFQGRKGSFLSLAPGTLL